MKAKTEKPILLHMILSVISCSVILGVLYIIPEPWQTYIINVYSVFAVLAIIMYTFTYIGLELKWDAVSKSLDRVVTKRIGNDDIYFIRRMLNQKKAFFQAIVCFLINALFAFIGGTILESLLFVVVFTSYAVVVFLVVDKTNTEVYHRYNGTMLKYLNSANKPQTNP